MYTVSSLITRIVLLKDKAEYPESPGCLDKKEMGSKLSKTILTYQCEEWEGWIAVPVPNNNEAEIYGVFIILDVVLFTWNNSFILKTQIWGQQLYELYIIIIPIYRQESWGTESLSYLSKITELKSSSAENQTWAICLQGLCFKSLHFTLILLYYHFLI